MIVSNILRHRFDTNCTLCLHVIQIYLILAVICSPSMHPQLQLAQYPQIYSCSGLIISILIDSIELLTLRSFPNATIPSFLIKLSLNARQSFTYSF